MHLYLPVSQPPHLFDHGSVVVAENLSLIGVPGRLTVQPRHRVSQEHLRCGHEDYRAGA